MTEDIPYTLATVLILRTKRVLDARQREHEDLGRRLEATGLTSHGDRADWLIANANPLDILARELRQAALDGWHPSHDHLGIAKPIRRMPRHTFTDRQLAIAIAVQEKADAA